MSRHSFAFANTTLEALPSGGLYWPERDTLVVSDLHLGKSDRIARRGGTLLPPYEVAETLSKLDHDLRQTNAARVICLGDSFDDLAASRDLSEQARLQLITLQAGRRWIWIEGNHDPGPINLGGTHLGELAEGPLVFRHIATKTPQGEVSGHYHPKTTLSGLNRPCFIYDKTRLILPAYGAYTGGLRTSDPVIQALFPDQARMILTGTKPGRPPIIAPLKLSQSP